MTSEGYNVDTFTDSFETLKHFIKLNRPYYDLVILDIRMDDMNGTQLYQKLKRIDAEVRVIFATALDAAEELFSIIPDLNSVHIIRKPIAAKDFINSIIYNDVGCHLHTVTLLFSKIWASQILDSRKHSFDTFSQPISYHIFEYIWSITFIPVYFLHWSLRSVNQLAAYCLD